MSVRSLPSSHQVNQGQMRDEMRMSGGSESTNATRERPTIPAGLRAALFRQCMTIRYASPQREAWAASMTCTHVRCRARMICRTPRNRSAVTAIPADMRGSSIAVNNTNNVTAMLIAPSFASPSSAALLPSRVVRLRFADLKYLGSATTTRALNCRPAVLQGDLLGVLHIDLLTALHAVRLSHADLLACTEEAEYSSTLGLSIWQPQIYGPRSHYGVAREAALLLQVDDLRRKGVRGYVGHVRALPRCDKVIAEVSHGAARW